MRLVASFLLYFMATLDHNFFIYIENANMNSNSISDDVAREYYLKAKMNYSIEDLYTQALQFFKEKEDLIARTISYEDRVQLSGYIKQISKGNFNTNTQSADVGPLNVVGKNRNTFWASLKDMSKEKAMLSFTDLLSSHCPSFIIHSNTHFVNNQISKYDAKVYRQDIDNDFKETADSLEKDGDIIKRDSVPVPLSNHDDDGGAEGGDDEKIKIRHLKKEERKLKHEAFKRKMKEELDKQTSAHFVQYAQEQHPDDPQRQGEVVLELQRQHFEYYYHNVYLQQVVHQRQQYYQLQAMAQQMLEASDEQEFITNAVIKNQHNHQVSAMNQAVDEENVYHRNKSNSVGDSTPLLVDGGSVESIQLSSKMAMLDEVKIINETQPAGADHAFAHDKLAAGDSQTDEEEEEEEEEDERDSEFEEISERMPPLTPARMWTQQTIEAFKQTYRHRTEHVIKVSSLSTATVKVPTLDDRSEVTWQFASDHFDVGFGIFFEWSVLPPGEVVVQVNDSSDEEGEGTEDESAERRDVEKGGGEQRHGPPMDELVQVVRRDSHLEVQCGRHLFPGKGVYHFKFDNSFSLWRSKTIYYNIVYK